MTHAAPIVSIAELLEPTGSSATGALLPPEADPARIADRLDALALIAIDFPSLSDGRGLSLARQLRQRWRYRGELRAIGPLLPDQHAALAACGFDSVAPEPELPATAIR